jgi:hypothetical protein
MGNHGGSIRGWLVVLALGLGLSVVAGCGGGSKSRGPTAPVKGKVTYNGKALPAGCTIMFVHQKEGFPASAPIGADGGYTLMFNGKPAVPLGTYKVAVVPPASAAASGPPPDPSNPEAYKAFMMGGKPKPTAVSKQDGAAAFPKKFQAPETTTLTMTVVEGQGAYDVDLKD